MRLRYLRVEIYWNARDFHDHLRIIKVVYGMPINVQLRHHLERVGELNFSISLFFNHLSFYLQSVNIFPKIFFDFTLTLLKLALYFYLNLIHTIKLALVTLDQRMLHDEKSFFVY